MKTSTTKTNADHVPRQAPRPSIRSGPRRASLRPLLLLATLATSIGCSDVRNRLYQVDGKVFVGDQPAANASLAFHPTGDAKAKYILPVGVTGPDGSYHL